jgi:pSer/pThr/pTyr-binding forkhead associated (FHA) protein
MSTLILLCEKGMPCEYSDKEIHYTSSEAPSRGYWLWGRGENCDLVLESRSISREHCTISYSPSREQWELTDQHSTNGTWVNGKKIQPKGPGPLQPEVRFTLGTLPFEFVVLEEFNDTLNDYEMDGEPTIASPEPLVATTSSKTLGDSLYDMTRWLISGQAMPGRAYRLGVAVVLTAVASIVIGALFL